MSSPCGPDLESADLHASAVVWCGQGVLLRGRPGAGKSTVTAGLMAMGAYLVADDLVRVEHRGRALYAGAVAAHGLIELRGSGIFRLATTQGVRVRLCVELEPSSRSERLPARRCTSLLGVDMPLLVIDGRDPASTTRILIALTALRVD